MSSVGGESAPENIAEAESGGGGDEVERSGTHSSESQGR